MSKNKNNLSAFIRILQRNNPELLDIISSRTEEEFDSAFLPIIGKAVNHLEENRKNFETLEEEGFTAAFVGCLKGIGLSITQETNSNGHVDAIIKAEYCTPVKTRLLEAKVYNGYERHISGLDQLVNSYSNGREGSGLLIEYVKKDKIKDKIKELREQMDKNLPLNQVGKSADHVLRWSFKTVHQHNSGENLKVEHISCNLHNAPANSKKKAT